MFNPSIILGVELELEVRHTNPGQSITWVAPYEIQRSGYGHGFGKTFHNHGNIPRAISKATKDWIQTGYDGTLSDGFELRGNPDLLGKNKEMWGKFLELPITGYLMAAASTGMHIHVSGPICTPATLAKVAWFVNNRDNKPLIRYIADRELLRYAAVSDVAITDILALWHSPNCKNTPRKRFPIHNHMKHSYKPTGAPLDCCKNARKPDTYIRGAIHLKPRDNTGDCEFRMFQSTVDPKRFMVNLEFVTAIFDYCYQVPLSRYKSLRSEDFLRWLQSKLYYRVRYPFLYRRLREKDWVAGLIPKKDRFREKIMEGRVAIPEALMVG